tara:strand:- start:1357 stop:1566 length:210 start_codon:yes stop_codon:yes gene_type:complete
MEQATLEIYKYLVNLRNSGATNMWGASIYLEDAFDLSKQEAKNALLGWIKTFDLPEDEQPQDGRTVRPS